MSINNEWRMVREFHEKFARDLSDTPVMLARNQAEKRYMWMKEEIDEFLEAGDITEQADAMVDLIYFALGTLAMMGVKPEKPFAIVHGANMAKLWGDGKPRYNADGKVIKPETWADPYPALKACVERGGDEV
jgi:predicted HAD superfamily Cof-like phosphohydrolase